MDDLLVSSESEILVLTGELSEMLSLMLKDGSLSLRNTIYKKESNYLASKVPPKGSLIFGETNDQNVPLSFSIT